MKKKKKGKQKAVPTPATDIPLRNTLTGYYAKGPTLSEADEIIERAFFGARRMALEGHYQDDPSALADESGWDDLDTDDAIADAAASHVRDMSDDEVIEMLRAA